MSGAGRLPRPVKAFLAIALPLAITACSSTNEPESPIVAAVGQEVFSRSDLERRILGRFSERRVLLGLVRDSLWRQEARRLGVEVTPDDVAQAVARVTAGQRETLQVQLEAAGLTWADHEWELAQELRPQLLKERVVRALRDVGERQLLDRYERTFAKEQVELGHIAVAFEGEGASDQVMLETRARAESLVEELRQGADFAKIAREVSSDARSRDRDGRLGRVGWDLVPAHWKSVIAELEPGEISAPILEDGYGYHVFRLEKRWPPQPFEEVRELLRTELEEAPVTLEEIAFVEERLRRRYHVELFTENLRSPAEMRGDRAPLTPSPTRGTDEP